MTAPDDGLEQVLRQALSSAAGQVEPGDGGLERILVRTGTTPPRPWLSSVAAEAVRRVRHWTWRGHWAWQDWDFAHPGFWRAWLVRLVSATGLTGATDVAVLARRAAAWRPWGSLRPAARPHGPVWIRLAAGVAAAASITAVAMAVPPVRAALVEVSSGMLSGGNQAVPQGTGGAGGPGGTNGDGLRDGTTTTAGGAHAVRPSGSASPTGTFPTQLPGTLPSQLPCPPSATGSERPAATPTVSPSAVQASDGPVTVPSAAPLHPTPTPSCPTATGGPAGQPTQTPAPPSSSTPAATQPTVAPTTAPPSSGAPSPTDSATPAPTPTPAQTSGTEPGAAVPSSTGDGPASAGVPSPSATATSTAWSTP